MCLVVDELKPHHRLPDDEADRRGFAAVQDLLAFQPGSGLDRDLLLAEHGDPVAEDRPCVSLGLEQSGQDLVVVPGERASAVRSRSMYCSAQAGTRSTSGRFSTAVASAPFVSSSWSSRRARSGRSERRPCSMEAIVSTCTPARSASWDCVRPAVTRNRPSSLPTSFMADAFLRCRFLGCIRSSLPPLSVVHASAHSYKESVRVPCRRPSRPRGSCLEARSSGLGARASGGTVHSFERTEGRGRPGA